MKGNSLSYVILSICMAVVNCEFYSSVHEVTKLVDYERFLLGKMERFVTLNENKLNYLKEKLYEFEREREDAQEAGDEYYENPINKYLLTRRLTLDWEKLENFLDHEVGTSAVKSIDEFKKNYTFPEDDDFSGAIDGILRLQRVYQMDTKDIAQGVLGGVKDSSELSAKDCYDFGKHALKMNNLIVAYEWLSEAYERFEGYNPTVIDEQLNESEILQALAEAHLGLSQSKPSDGFQSEHEITTDDLYEATCSGELHRTPTEERPLRCMYVDNNVPFLKIAPFKMEQMNLEPLIVYYHEVIYDNEIKQVLQAAELNIKRSTIGDFKTAVVSTIRTSKNTWLAFDKYPFLANIKQRLLDMTQLSFETAEELQVANYGIGGHYGQHFDFFYTIPPHDEWRGNRMATALFYITDVELGGGTAFPFLMFTVKPVKRSLVFWYNLHNSTDPDYRMKHAGCPVLKGSKWILNLWTRERGQEFIRPCGLQSTAYLSEKYKNE